MDLSIIIVSWNVRDLLNECINSIFKHTRGISFEIFVIDNNSSDQTVAMLRKHFPQVNLIVNKNNDGFAAANNQGINKAKGNFIMLLNPDTMLHEDSFNIMINLMRKTDNCGVMGCHLLNPDQTHQDSIRRLPGFWDQAWILLKLQHLLPFFPPFKRYLAQDFDYKRPQSVDQVMGACFMINRKLIDGIGNLDKYFFIWFEEVDFCQRAKQAGWQIRYTPDTSIIHHFGQSFKQVMTVKKQKIWNKSLCYYFLKHHGSIQYIIITILSYVSLILAFLINIFRFKKANNHV